MTSKRIACTALLFAGSSLLLATPGLAQTPPSHHYSGPHGGPPGGSPGGHPGGAPHFTFAHRDFGHFTPGERSAWVGGRWNHAWHNGRYGWWWFAGGAWYFYDAPIYPYPGYVSDDYVDAGDYGPPGQYWYYCQNPPGYFPYVQTCRIPWQPVPAAPPPQAGYGPPPGGGYGPPPGAAGGPPDDGPPPGYEGPGPDDQPPPGPPGYPPGPQPGNQGPGPAQGPGDQPLPPPNNQPPNGYNGPSGPN